MVDNEDHCVLHNASVLEHMGSHQWPFQFSKNLFPDIFPDQGPTDRQVDPRYAIKQMTIRILVQEFEMNSPIKIVQK